MVGNCHHHYGCFLFTHLVSRFCYHSYFQFLSVFHLFLFYSCWMLFFRELYEWWLLCPCSVITEVVLDKDCEGVKRIMTTNRRTDMKNTFTQTHSQENDITSEKTCSCYVSSKYTFVYLCLTVWSKQGNRAILYFSAMLLSPTVTSFISSPFRLTQNRHIHTFLNCRSTVNRSTAEIPLFSMEGMSMCPLEKFTLFRFSFPKWFHAGSMQVACR